MEKDSIGPSRRLFRLAPHQLKRIHMGFLAFELLQAAEKIAEPPLAQGGGIGGGNRVPHPWNHVRIGERRRIGVCLGRHDIDVARRGKLHDAVAWLNRACAIVLDGGIGGTADDWRPRWNPQVGGGLRADFADHIGWLNQLWKRRALQSRKGDQLIRPIPRLHVEK